MTWTQFGLEFQVDETITRTYYAQAETWDCPCGHCRNFLTLARTRRLPVPVLDFLDRLSIPPEKATYVCELYHETDRLYYQFNVRLPGSKPAHAPEHDTIPQDWGDVWCGQELYPSAEDFPEPHFDVSFFLWLPWTLDEPLDAPETEL